MKLLSELLAAMQEASLMARVTLEDEWGAQYDLLSARAYGQQTGLDSELRLMIRRHGVHPDAGATERTASVGSSTPEPPIA
jgi:hypothetical protein